LSGLLKTKKKTMGNCFIRKTGLMTVLFILLATSLHHAQVVINEVHVKPSGGDLDQAFQSMYNSTPNFGSEFVEIYNTSSCSSVDISCWTIGGMDGGTNGGAFSFPAGTVIAPLSFITVGGPNTPGVTFNLNLAANSARLWRSNAARWHLPNGDGWLALYDATGAAVDAVYWTFASNDPTKLNSDATYTTGVLQRIGVCGGGGLATASSIPGIEYIPQATVTGQSYERSTDGGNTWVLGTATPNNCNGICATSSAFQLNATVVQPTCGNNNGSISFAPSPSDTYFYTWPFPSNWTVSSVNDLAPGTYPVTITNDLGCSIDTTIVLTDIPCGNVCDPNANLVIYSNYDGGILTINVDQNIPDLRVGICTYEPIQVTFTGPFVGNITQVIYAGMNSNQNNNNCGLGNFTTSVTGVPAGIVTISPPMNPPLVGYTPAHGNGAGPWGGQMIGVAGLCDTTVNAGGGNTPDEVVYYFLNATGGTLLHHQTQYACWVNETVNVSAGGNCCIIPQVNVPCPTITVNTTAQTNVACFGQSTGSATLAASGGAASYTYTWTPGNLNGANQNALGAGTYTVNVVDGNNCPGTTSVTITQPATAVTVTTTATNTDCGASTGTATANPSGGTPGYTYSWSPSGGTGATASNLAAGNYTVTVTDQNGCQATASATVGTLNGPSISVASSDDVSCNGSSDGAATVSGTGGTGALTYTWTPGNLSGATQSNLSAGTYTITVSDAAGCTSSTTVTIGQPTAISVTETITPAGCGSADGSVSTAVNGGTGPYTYSWSPGGSTASSISGLVPGSYSVTVTDQSGCTVTESYAVTQTGSLNVDAQPENSTIDEGNSVQFTTSGATTYSWTPSSTLDCSDCPDPIATPTVTTMYIVTGTDINGCFGSDTVYVTVIPTPIVCGKIYVPTILSPNGSGSSANKTICVYGNCVSEITFAIFNRWGEKVFETTDINLTECWDGTYKGKELNSGTFVYKLLVTLWDGEIIEDSGNITLVR
jgi:gliding motility-associated-like protein